MVVKTSPQTQKELLSTIDKLKEEVATLKEIIKHVPGNLFWKDENGQYLGCNNNLAKFLGLSSPDEIIGKTNRELMEQEYAHVLDTLDKDIESRQGRYIEEKGLDINQNEAIFLSQKLPIHINGARKGVIGLSFNITERKKIEAELQRALARAEVANEAKSKFLAVVNHELRTPLTGIIGLVNLINSKLQNKADLSLQGMMDNLQNCSEYMASLVNDILDFTRLEAGKYKTAYKPTSLIVLFNELQGIISALAMEKALNINFKLPQDMPLILIDPRMLKQIIINIAFNAIKFTEHGSVTICLEIEPKKSDTLDITICIQDTGKGIPAKDLNNVFEPFYQLEDTYKRESSRSGTGLGLAIVKNFADLLKLKVEIESEVRKGTTFTLSGNFKIASRDAIICNQPDANPQVILQNKYALLVEDDPIVSFVHSKFLSSLGLTVVSTLTGAEAINTAQCFDIILVDVGLPDIAGFEVIKAYRQRMQAEGWQAPIIALTGYTELKEKLACLEAGADEVAIKPISEASLKMTIERQLQNYELT